MELIQLKKKIQQLFLKNIINSKKNIINNIKLLMYFFYVNLKEKAKF